MSKRHKSPKKSPPKTVCFAEKIVMSSHVVKSRPCIAVKSIKIGSIDLDIPDDRNPSSKVSLPRILKDCCSTESRQDCDQEPPSSSYDSGSNSVFSTNSGSSANSGSSLLKGSSSVHEVINHARRIGGCTRCFIHNHSQNSCRSMLRCAVSFNYGHRFKFCFTKRWPYITWQPKSLESERAKESAQETGLEAEMPFGA